MYLVMKQEKISEKHFTFILNKKEAVDLISFLAAQLGDVAVNGNFHGACPTITDIYSYERYSFVIELLTEKENHETVR